MSDVCAPTAAPVALPNFLRAPARRPPPDVEFAVELAGGAVRAGRGVLALAPRRARGRGRLYGSREALAPLSETALNDRLAQARADLRARGAQSDARVAMLALAAETARRRLGLAPFPSQLACASALLGGAVAEMETGEGKTLAAFLAAAVFAASGRGVHVVTANDYLAGRDAESLRPAFSALGLSVGVVVGGDESASRREAYGADVVYLSSKEVAFDYLRDGLTRPRRGRRSPAGGETGAPVRRGGGGATARRLDVALVDEIDSVLVDEATTPLLISTDRPGDITEVFAREALELAEDFVAGADYAVDPFSLTPALTPRGQERLEEASREFSGKDSGPWRVRLIREEMLRAAIAARRLLKRDQHYLVRDGKIALIDQESGRIMPDRHWSHGLNLMVEVKEGCVSTGEKKSLASISFQRFFRQYALVCGMSGTVREVAGELHAVYGLKPAWIARRLPLRRVTAPRHTFPDRDALWAEAAKDRRRLAGARPAGPGRRAQRARGGPRQRRADGGGRRASRPQRRAGRRGGGYRRRRRPARGHQRRHQHGGTRHRHQARRGRRRTGRPRRPDLRTPRFPPRRSPADRPLRPAGRSRPGHGAGLAAGRRVAAAAALGNAAGAALAAPAAFRDCLGAAGGGVRHGAARLQLLRRDEQLARLMAFAGGLD